MVQTVGVIGLGNMGTGIAGQLLNARFNVAVYNRTASAADPLVARGARRAATPADAVEPGGVVLTMVADDSALQAVTLGEGGLLGRLAGGVHISCSTVSAATARTLAERHAAAGCQYVSAPVFGRPDAAAAGKLWVLHSGLPAAKAQARPVLEAISQGIVDIGEAAEAASLGKIAGNFMIASAIETMSEAIALLRKSGVDPRIWHDLMARSLFACPIYANYGRFILDQAFSPPGFRLTLGAKDVGLALAAGQDAKVPLPFASLLRDRFLSAIAQGRGDLDWTSIAVNVANDAGLSG
jgi:3-hydroxyisobutyrate dehydrogenase-like beta-hydroxyacid dehydrogenase